MADANGQRTAVIVIHGVGEADSGWINSYIVDPIAGIDGIETDFKCEPYSEVYPLCDGDHAALKFTAVVRRASVCSRDVGFIEMFWADLSRVTGGSLAYFLATMNLIFVAPGVLAQAFLRRRWRGLHRLIGALVVASSRILSWFIVGVNVTILACAVFVSTIWWLQSAKFLPGSLTYSPDSNAIWLALPTVALFAFGIYSHRANRQTDIAWSDFSLGLALSSGSVLLYAIIGNALAYSGYTFPCTSETILCQFVEHWNSQGDFDKGRDAVFLIWMAWCATTLLAIALLLLIHLTRWLGLRSKDDFPLVSTWNAIFTILIQAILFKLIITPLSILACKQLTDAYESVAPGKPATAICDVHKASGIFSFTILETVFIVAGLAYIIFARSSAARRNAPDEVPRLIVHPLLILLAAVTVTAHIVVFLEQMLVFKNGVAQAYGDLPAWAKPFFPLLYVESSTWGLPKSAGYDRIPSEWKAVLVWLVPVYMYLLGATHSASKPVVHIARQLVDHQYRAPRPALNFLRRHKKPWIKYPRRQRIAARLDAIVKAFLSSRNVDKLVFLTHSQGSVIMFDYLTSPDKRQVLEGVGEIHVVTMGSPLSHLYATYFDEYSKPLPRSELLGNIKSWTNFWRIDDPIGNRVEVVGDGFIENRLLGRGGHVNYWKEREVQAHICGLIEIPLKVKEEVSA